MQEKRSNERRRPVTSEAKVLTAPQAYAVCNAREAKHRALEVGSAYCLLPMRVRRIAYYRGGFSVLPTTEAFAAVVVDLGVVVVNSRPP